MVYRGTSTVDSCEIHCSETDPQVVVTVSRPVDSGWLWDRIYHLLAEFELFLWRGDEVALAARDGVPTPAQMTLTSVLVANGSELRDAFESA